MDIRFKHGDFHMKEKIDLLLGYLKGIINPSAAQKSTKTADRFSNQPPPDPFRNQPPPDPFRNQPPPDPFRNQPPPDPFTNQPPWPIKKDDDK